MHILFIVLVHKNADQLIRLYNRLNSRESTFIFHVCKNTARQDFIRIREYFRKKRNVYFSKRERGTWASYDFVRAILNCFKVAVNEKLKFDYLQVLSGQDYPIKPIDYIREFFEKNHGRQFLSFKAVNETVDVDEEYLDPVRNMMVSRDQSNRYKYPYIKIVKNFYIRVHSEQNPRAVSKWDFFKDTVRSNLRFFERRWFKESLPPYYGSSWINISYACFKEVVEYCSNNRDYLRYHKWVYSSDELFFHSIILNSRFRDSCINDSLRYITWNSDVSKHPLILDEKDFARISASEALIARKFDLAAKPKIFDLIDSHLLESASSVELSKLKLA